MALIFYPAPEDAGKGSLEERVDILTSAAELYKSFILDAAEKIQLATSGEEKKMMAPRDQVVAFNWEEIASVLRSIRSLSESTGADKIKKAGQLTKLAEVYEILRAAKMPKLEAVRLALISEVGQLRGGSSQVA